MDYQNQNQDQGFSQRQNENKIQLIKNDKKNYYNPIEPINYYDNHNKNENENEIKIQNLNKYPNVDLEKKKDRNRNNLFNENTIEDIQNPYTETIIPIKDIENNQNIYDDYTLYSGDFTNIIRMGFIKKVYGILSAQLLFTLGFICFTFIDNFALFLIKNIAIFYICCIISIIISFILICFKKIARKIPINYLLFSIWTFCESWMVGVLSAFYDPKSIMFIGILTAGVTCSLTYYARTTKTDFTFCGGILFASVFIIFTMGTFFLILGISKYNFPLLNILYSGLGVFVYSLYLIFDTQLIMGKFGNGYNIDDYLIASLNIYIYIIQLFIYILELFGRRR